MQNYVRLKSDFVVSYDSHDKANICNKDFQKFMYFLDLDKFKTVHQLKQDICARVFHSKAAKYQQKLKVFVDDFEIPDFETTTIFREMDNVK